MAFQILQKGPSAMQGALLGLGQGLQEAALSKLQQMRQANEQAQFAKTLRNANFEPGVANLIASLPLEQRLKALSPYLNDPNFLGNANIQPQPQTGATQPQRVSVVQEEPTIYSTAAQQQQLAGQQPQQQAQQPQLPSSFDMAQEVRRNALGFPESFSPQSVQDLIKQFENFGHQFSPQQRARIEQEAAQLAQDPQKMAALQQQYDQAVKNNEQIELRRPGYTGAATPIQQLQQLGQPLYRQPVKPLTTSEKIAQEGLEIKKRKEEREAYKDVKPYLDAQRTDFENASKEYKTAKDMLGIITKYKDEFPTISGYLPEKLQRNPHVREYTRLGNQLVLIQTNSLKGQPTNYKTQIVERAKIDLSQPIETQIGALNKIIANDKKVFDTQDEINKISEINQGRFPIDLAQKIIQKIGRPDIAETQSIKAGMRVSDVNQSSIPVGQKAIDPATNESFTWNGKDWVHKEEDDGKY